MVSLEVESELRGESEVLGQKSCPIITFSTTKPTYIAFGSNPGRRSGSARNNNGILSENFFDVASLSDSYVTIKMSLK